jgi:hypothetical protein
MKIKTKLSTIIARKIIFLLGSPNKIEYAKQSYVKTKCNGETAHTC